MRLATILIAIGVLVFPGTACNSKPSRFPLHIEIEWIQEIQDGRILFEENGPHILVTLIDKYGDGHIFVLNHADLSRTQALETLKRKQAELERGRGVLP